MSKIDKDEFEHRLELIQNNTWQSIILSCEIDAQGITSNAIHYTRGKSSSAQMDIDVMYDCYDKCYTLYGNTPFSRAKIQAILPSSYNAHYSFWMSAMEEIRVGHIHRISPRKNTITLI